MYAKPLSFVLDLLKSGQLPPCFNLYEPQAYGQPTRSLVYAPDDATPEDAAVRLQTYAEVFFASNPGGILRIAFMNNKSAKADSWVWHNVSGNAANGDLGGLGSFGGQQTGQVGLGVLNQLMGVFDQKMSVERERSLMELKNQRLEWEYQQRRKEQARRNAILKKRAAEIEAREKEIGNSSYFYQSILAGAGKKFAEEMAASNPALAGLMGVETKKQKEETEESGKTFGAFLDNRLENENLSNTEYEQLARTIDQQIRAFKNRNNGNGQNDEPTKDGGESGNDS